MILSWPLRFLCRLAWVSTIFLITSSIEVKSLTRLFVRVSAEFILCRRRVSGRWRPGFDKSGFFVNDFSSCEFLFSITAPESPESNRPLLFIT